MLKIKVARGIMRRAFKKDPDFRQVYKANIACCIYDHDLVDTMVSCSEAADKVLDLIFSK